MTWTNQDQDSYFISENDQSFAFNLTVGGSFKITFNETGVFNYHCTTRPAMQGTVIVTSGDSCQISNQALSEEELIAKVRPSVVTVKAETASLDTEGKRVSQQLSGTGWILNENGLIVTNNHVVSGAQQVKVTLDDGRTYQASAIHTDPLNDLAVIEIQVNHLQAADVGDSSRVRVGDRVIALGNTNGDGIQAAAGVISATGSTLVAGTSETLYDMFQITAPISFGNSGGPLIDLDGKVIGITSAGKLTRSGVTLAGYAITADAAGPILQQLIQNGAVSLAWLGVTTSSVSQFQSLGYRLNRPDGALVTETAINSPAEKVGLKPGDIIVNFAGKNISSTDELVKMVRTNQTGTQVEIGYWRGNELQGAVVTLGSNPGS